MIKPGSGSDVARMAVILNQPIAKLVGVGLATVMNLAVPKDRIGTCWIS